MFKAIAFVVRAPIFLVGLFLYTVVYVGLIVPASLVYMIIAVVWAIPVGFVRAVFRSDLSVWGQELAGAVWSLGWMRPAFGPYRQLVTWQQYGSA
jgi:hypothetical protein